MLTSNNLSKNLYSRMSVGHHFWILRSGEYNLKSRQLFHQFIDTMIRLEVIHTAGSG